MKKVLTISIMIFGLLSLESQAQKEVGATIQDFHKSFQMSRNEFTTASELDYDGTPYMNDEFLPGRIFTPDNVQYVGVDIRYNIYEDNFEFNKDGVAMALDKSSRWPKFIVNDQVFEYKHYSYKSASTRGYLETLVDGTYSFYLKHTVVLKEAEEPGAYSEATKAWFYSIRPETMVGRNGKDIIKISNIKDLYKFFPETEEMLSGYSGGKRIKLKNNEDYIKVIEYLNSKED